MPRMFTEGSSGGIQIVTRKVIIEQESGVPQGCSTPEPKNSIHGRHPQLIKNIEILGLATKQDGRRYCFFSLAISAGV